MPVLWHRAVLLQQLTSLLHDDVQGISNCVSFSLLLALRVIGAGAVHDDGSSVGPSESLLGNGRSIGTDDTADGHEEAARLLVVMWIKAKPGFAYPKVAPEPSMYCPRVLMMPLGPAP